MLNIPKVSLFAIALFLGGARSSWTMQNLQPQKTDFPAENDNAATTADLNILAHDDNASEASFGSTYEKLVHPESCELELFYQIPCEDCDGGHKPGKHPPVHPFHWVSELQLKHDLLIAKVDGIRANVDELTTATDSLKKQMRPLNTLHGTVTTNRREIQDNKQRISEINENFTNLSEQHNQDIAELDSKIDKLKRNIGNDVQNIKTEIFQTVQDQLKESANQQQETTQETVSAVSDDLITIKRILGAPDDHSKVDLVDNNLTNLKAQIETETRRIDRILKRLGPVEALENHAVFVELSQGSLPTGPLTVAQMITELANAYVKFRSDLPQQAKDMIDQKFSEIDSVLAPLVGRIDGNRSDIDALKELLGDVSSENIKKIEELEKIVEEETRKQLNTGIGNKIEYLCNVFVEKKLDEMSNDYEQRIKDCEQNLVQQHATDEDLDQRLKDCNQELEALQTLVGNSSGYPSGSDSLSTRLVQLRRDLEELSGSIPERLGERIEALEGSSGGSKDIDDQISALKNELGELSKDLNSIKNSTLEDLISRVETLEQIDHNALKNELRTEMQNSLDAKIDEIKQTIPDDFERRLEILESINVDAKIAEQIAALREEFEEKFGGGNGTSSGPSPSIPENLEQRLENLEIACSAEQVANIRRMLDELSASGALNKVSELVDRVAALEASDFETKISDVQEHINTEVSRLEEEIERLKTDSPTDVTEQINALGNRVQRIEDLDLDTRINTEIERLEAKIPDDLTGQLSAITNRVVVLEDAHLEDKIDAEISRLEAKIPADPSEEIKSLTESINQIKEANFETKLATEIARIEAKIPADSTERLNDLDGRMQNLEAACSPEQLVQIKQLLDEMAADGSLNIVSSLTSRVQNLENGDFHTRVANLEEDLGKISSSVSTEEIININNRIQILENACYDDSITALQNEDRRLNDLIAALERKHDEEIGALTRRLDAIEPAIASFNDTLGNLSDVLDAHQNAINDAVNAINALNSHITNLNALTSQHENRIGNLETTVNQVVTKIEQITNDDIDYGDTSTRH